MVELRRNICGRAASLKKCLAMTFDLEARKTETEARDAERVSASQERYVR
jgi:hypothetical protein